MTHHERQATPERLVVVGFDDPYLDARGHRPGSPYVEAVWLPILGPSATWAWQRLARLATARPTTSFDSADLAAGLGLSPALGANSVLSRTLWRLSAFGAASRNGDTLAVRRALPDVPARQLDRLPGPARLAHQRLAANRHPTHTPSPAPTPEFAQAVQL